MRPSAVAEVTKFRNAGPARFKRRCCETSHLPLPDRCGRVSALSMAQSNFILGRLLAAIFCSSVWTTVASSQTVAIGEEGQMFYQMGIDTNDSVTILGTADGGATLYEFTGTSFRALPFPPLVSVPDVPNETRLSRDGQCVVTRDDALHPEFSVSLPALWIRSGDYKFLYPNLPALTDDFRLNPGDVANIPSGPVVVCGDFPTSIFWIPQNGLTPWITNDKPFVSRLEISRISADGLTFAGYEVYIEREGDPMRVRAISGTRTHFSYLPPPNSEVSAARAISPNGSFISGFADNQPVLWHDGKVKRLINDKRVVGSAENVTDHGFVGLSTAEGPMIYDPRLRKTFPFSEWWDKHYLLMPLPHRIRQIRDLHEHGGNLYCLLVQRDDDLGIDFGVLAILPIPDLPTKPKGGRADSDFDE